MLDIFILEDNITQQFRIERQIEAIMRKNNWAYQHLEAFAVSNDIIARVSKEDSHQIFFLI